MSNEDCLLITIFYNGQLLRCAVKFNLELIHEEVIEYWAEPEHSEKLYSLLPLHCHGGVIVEVQRIFEVWVVY
ncbi:MAG: hypothetical protein WBC34_09520 [Thiofilum sp.]